MKIRRRGGSGAQGMSSARRPMNLKHHLTPALSPTSYNKLTDTACSIEY
jgi:hypothetical protein